MSLMKPPVKEGEELDVKIEAIGNKGDGLTKLNGYTIFVPDTKEGDQVKIIIKRALPRVAFAEKV